MSYSQNKIERVDNKKKKKEYENNNKKMKFDKIK